MRDVLTFILAGGKGERLHPLTRDRAKPAVPFGGIYRIIDFTLSNCINSGLRRIYILIQYKSFSLQKHLISGWDIVSTQLGEFIDVIPAQQRISSDWYRGTADAIYQNLYAIHDHDPDLILVLAGDHIYKMNYGDLIAYHHEKGAEMTVACIPMPASTSEQFGVIEIDERNRVFGFQEKPSSPKTIPGDSQTILASMGIYLFNKDCLLDELEQDARKTDSDHDFGKNVIPQMIAQGKKVLAYRFADQEGRPHYWRDIGTRDAYYQANMDLIRPDPPFNLFDRSWPMRTYHEQFPPVRALSHSDGRGRKGKDCQIINALIAGGCSFYAAHVESSVLSPNVTLEEGAVVKNSVVMEGVIVSRGAHVQNAIIDKQNIIPPGSRIGFDRDADEKKFFLTSSGIVIIPKRTLV